MISTGHDFPWSDDAIVLVSREPVSGAIGLATAVDDGIAGYVELAQPDTFAHLVVRAAGQPDEAVFNRVVGRQAALRLAQLSRDWSRSAASPPVMRLLAAEPLRCDESLRIAQVEMIRRWLHIDLDERLLDLDLMAARCEALPGRMSSADVGADLAAAVEYADRVTTSADDDVPAPHALIRELLRVLAALSVPAAYAAAGADRERVQSRLITLAEGEAARRGGFATGLKLRASVSHAARDANRFPLHRRDLPARILAFDSEPEACVHASRHLAHVLVSAFPGGVCRDGATQLVVRLVDFGSRFDLAWAELVPNASGTQFRATLASMRASSGGLADGSIAVEVLRGQDAETPWEPPDLPQLTTDNAILDAFALVRAGISAHSLGDRSWAQHLALAGSCLSVSNRDLNGAQRAQLHQMRQFRQRVSATLAASAAGLELQRWGTVDQASEAEALAWRGMSGYDVSIARGIGPGQQDPGWPPVQRVDGLPASLRPTLAELDARWTAARETA